VHICLSFNCVFSSILDKNYNKFLHNIVIQIILQLLFPTADSVRPFSMLGLGDIVIPGRMTLHLCIDIIQFSF